MKNKLILVVKRKDPEQFVVNDLNLKTLANFIKDVWKLKYFKRIVLLDLFETDFIPLNTGWTYKLIRELKANKLLYCEKRNLVVRGFRNNYF